MADPLTTTITKLIQSPPGQLAAGGVLAGIVWKFFERVEAVLTDQTKLEIAVWLIGVNTEKYVPAWHDTFLTLFDTVFGRTHPSWLGLRRTFVGTILLGMTSSLYAITDVQYQQYMVSLLTEQGVATLLAQPIWVLIIQFIVASVMVALLMVVPNYLALMLTRRVISQPIFLGVVGTVIAVMIGTAFIVFFVLTGYTGFMMSSASGWSLARGILHVWHNSVGALSFRDVTLFIVSTLPLFMGSVWLLLYAASGFMLKAARRFDIGFEWFNRKFDIEKKPLQSIGLVAGALVAIVYWVAVVVSRVVG